MSQKKEYFNDNVSWIVWSWETKLSYGCKKKAVMSFNIRVNDSADIIVLAGCSRTMDIYVKTKLRLFEHQASQGRIIYNLLRVKFINLVVSHKTSTPLTNTQIY